jgi:hypothetical protein
LHCDGSRPGAHFPRRDFDRSPDCAAGDFSFDPINASRPPRMQTAGPRYPEGFITGLCVPHMFKMLLEMLFDVLFDVINMRDVSWIG